MKLLLDTHAYLWFIAGSDRLSARGREAIETPENTICISSVSLWEITVKHALGKLLLEPGLEKVLSDYIVDNGFEILHIKSDHLLELSQLPMHHRDPFDRLLIAQCRSERMTILSADAMFGKYEVGLIG